jgi:uncharacterized protein YecT (DUF1311 family)
MNKTSGRRLALAAAAVTAAGLLAACSSSGQPADTAAGTGTPSSAGTASASAAAAAAFAPNTEPVDPGHPARAVSSPASCDQDSTLAIEQCYEHKTETADAAIDANRQAAFSGAPAAAQAAINAADRSWLASRPAVCQQAFHSGGTVDGINIAGCLLDESTARLDAVRGVTPPAAALKSTDSTSLDDVSWYTTPGGSRIGMIDTQGDAAGGAVISWVIIAGFDGFVINPAQFAYRDGSQFIDGTPADGTTGAPTAAAHRVAPGTEYRFSLDYQHLPTGSGGWVYAPGNPVAVWR